MLHAECQCSLRHLPSPGQAGASAEAGRSLSCPHLQKMGSPTTLHYLLPGELPYRVKLLPVQDLYTIHVKPWGWAFFILDRLTMYDRQHPSCRFTCLGGAIANMLDPMRLSLPCKPLVLFATLVMSGL